MAYYQQNMLSIKSRTLLAHILAEVALLNQSIQSFRQALADVPYFDTLALFRFIDRDQKGFISEKDINRIIGTSHRKLLTYAFTWMDNLKAGQVSRLEFATFLLPRDDLQLRQLVAQRVQRPELMPSQSDTIMQQFAILREMVLEIMRREMKLIQLRRELLSKKDYSLHGVVLAIDNNRHNWACAEDVLKFMKNFGFDLSLRQVQKLVEVLDFKTEGKLNQQQLKWTVQGLEGKDKEYLNRIKKSNKQKPPKKPINFEQQFQKHKSYNLNNYSLIEANRTTQGIYNQLISKIKLIEQEQKQIDVSLKLHEEDVLKNVKIQEQEEIINLKLRREAEIREKQRLRQQWFAKRQMDRQLDHIINKTAELQAQSDRLQRLENKMSIIEDTIEIKKNNIDESLLYPYQYQAAVNSRHYLGYSKPPSFGQQSNCNNYVLHQNKYPKTIQQKPLYPQHNNLEAAQLLRDKIKRQRQIQRQIRNKFTSNHLDKYNSYYKSNAYNNLSSEKKEYELGISSNKKKQINLEKQVDIKNIVSMESQCQENKYQRSKVKVNLQQQFQSPDPRYPRHQQESTLISKIGLSTANKPE